jgi:hypothetical protein
MTVVVMGNTGNEYLDDSASGTLKTTLPNSVKHKKYKLQRLSS